MDELRDEIKKILIFSNFREQEGGEGKTGKEIISFEQRAIDYYFGKNGVHDLHEVIGFNRFHARVEYEVALIMDAIKRHKPDKGEPRAVLEGTDYTLNYVDGQTISLTRCP